MFKREVGATFNDLWYRVAGRAPKLSPHARIVRQVFGGSVAYVVEDPTSGHFYRMSEPAYRFAGLLDGSRTVDQAWETCVTQLGDDAPTQKECLDVLGQLQLFGLLLGDVPVWADMLEQRHRQVRQSRRKRRTGNWLFYCIPLWNPDPALSRTLHLFAWLFSPLGAALWLAVVGTGLWFVLLNLGRLGDELDVAAMIDPRNVTIMGAVFLVLRAIHELGHAAACKALGGRSTELGVMLVAIVLPLPYCDATSSWRFVETWRRVLVAAAGVLAETFIAAIAAIIWATSEPGVVSAVCYNVMIISGVSTLLFNMNPLLRYDGYYILSDVTGIPNLAQRAKDFWKFMLERHVFGVRAAKPPHLSRALDVAVLAIFGLLSTPYRIFVAVSIILVVSQRYSSLGLVLAALCATLMLVWPLCKGIWHLMAAPSLMGRRTRAVGIVGGVCAGVVVILFAIPAPASIRTPGWVASREQGVLRTAEAGFIDRVLVTAGERVELGQPVMLLRNDELEAGVAIARAQHAQALAARDEARLKSATDTRAAEVELEAMQRGLDRALARAANLVVRAPAAGIVIPSQGAASDLSNLVGSYVPRGSMIGHVAETDRLIVKALLDDRDAGYVINESVEGAATFRVRGSASVRCEAVVRSVAPAGTRQLANPALANVAGGELEIEPDSREEALTLTPQFLVLIDAESFPEGVLPGQRAQVRLKLASRPLGVQLSRRVRQFWSSRFG